ncbi:NAD(P)-binding protein [Exidia glandulosa HHB12029]|uniref:NAD(P)-binding protein n=1 Tax=Exidia glandulosa HHB12029 TaxID=1314781 RepID=A0A166AYC0_EXIGL|nr:NAD(P)-binding protein [Exidia glandulosa HHB12029]
MFAKSQLLAVLFALPFALSQGGIRCNNDPITISNWTTSFETSGLRIERISFDVTSPDAGTSPQTHCTGAIVGVNRFGASGTCDDGGSWNSLALSGSATLTVVLPRECPRGSPFFLLRKYGGEGTWAVVTGGSTGIGRGYALQLAENGFNIVLVSLVQGDLDKVAREIAALPRTKVSTVQHAINFVTAGDAEWQALADVLTPLDVRVLINCAGTNHRSAAPFVSDGPQLSSAIIAVNTTATVRMTSLILPGMLARRKPALVLNMASHAGGVMPAPLHATYSGSKAFIVSWTQALGVELRKSGSLVDVAAINLGTVKVVQAPGLFQDFTPSFTVPSSERFARGVLASLGLQGGAVGRAFVMTPYWSHALLEFVVRSFGLENVAAEGAYNTLAHEAEQAMKSSKRE